MKHILSLTIAPIVSLVTIMLGGSFFTTYVGLRLSTEGESASVIGIMAAAFYAGMVLGALRIERLIHRIGHIRSFALFASSLSGVILLQAFSLESLYWIALRFCAGVCTAGLFIVIESWLLLLASHSTRGMILSIYMVALYSAQACSQFFLIIVEISSMTAFILAGLLCSFSIMPVSLMRAAAPTTPSHDPVNIFYLLKKTPLGFLGNFVGGMILGSFYGLAPAWAGKSGFGQAEVSMIMGITIAGGLALQMPIGHLSDRYDRRKVIIFTSLTLVAISLILFFLTEIPFWLLLTALFILGGFCFTIYPLSITYCCDFFSPAGITSVTCAALIIYGIGCVLGPIITPLVMELTSPSGLFLAFSIYGMLLALYAIWRTLFYRPISRTLKEPFTPNPGAGKLAELELEEKMESLQHDSHSIEDHHSTS